MYTFLLFQQSDCIWFQPYQFGYYSLNDLQVADLAVEE